MPSSINQKKVVLVTGASSGIGKETAKSLVKEGYIVYAAARRIEKMNDLKDFGVIPFKMDITKEEDIQSAVKRIQTEQGGVDILINNAGFGIQGSVEETTLADAKYQFEVNLFGLGRLTQLLIPCMREKKNGKIINIASSAGRMYVPLNAWYVATKHALEGWSDCLRFELKPFNIDVIIIEPGAIATEFNDVATDTLLKRSGHGPYSSIANALAKFSRDMDQKPNGGSPPSVISDTIIKSIKAKHPKTRYTAGKMAKQMIFIRKWFGDRFFDNMLSRTLR